MAAAELYAAAGAGDLARLKALLAARPDLDPLVDVHGHDLMEHDDADPMDVDILPPIDWQWDELVPALDDLNNANMDCGASTTTCSDDTQLFLEYADEEALREYIDRESPECALLAAAIAGHTECVELLLAHCKAAEMELYPWAVLLSALAHAPIHATRLILSACPIGDMIKSSRTARIVVLMAAAAFNPDTRILALVQAQVDDIAPGDDNLPESAARFLAAVGAEFPTLVARMLDDNPRIVMEHELPWSVAAGAIGDLAFQGDAANVATMVKHGLASGRATPPRDDDRFDEEAGNYALIFSRAVTGGCPHIVRELLATHWSDWIGGFRNDENIAAERERLVRLAVISNFPKVFVELVRDPRFSVAKLWMRMQHNGARFEALPVGLEQMREPMDAYLVSLVAAPPQLPDSHVPQPQPIDEKGHHGWLFDLPDLVLDELSSNHLDARSVGRLRQTCRAGTSLPIPSRLLPMRLLHIVISGQQLVPSAKEVFSDALYYHELCPLVQLRWLVRAAERGDAVALEYAMSQLPKDMLAPGELIPTMFLWAMHEIVAWSDPHFNTQVMAQAESAVVDHAKHMLALLVVHPQCPWWHLGAKNIVRAVLASDPPVPLSGLQSLLWRTAAATLMGEEAASAAVAAELTADPYLLAREHDPDSVMSTATPLQALSRRPAAIRGPSVVVMEDAFMDNQASTIAVWGVPPSVKDHQLDLFAYRCIAGRSVAAAGELLRAVGEHPSVVAAGGIGNVAGQWARMAAEAGRWEVARAFLDAALDPAAVNVDSLDARWLVRGGQVDLARAIVGR
ncbi:hypothetical protein BC828DRAFT_409719, partial [Blastocladiella britannica]